MTKSQKISISLFGKTGKESRNWKGGLPACKICDKKLGRRGRIFCKKHFPRDMRMIGLKGLLAQQNSKQPTSIEKIVYEYLKEQGIVFGTQELINGKFLVDAYIPSLRTVIEVDGDYWHSLPRVIKKDKAENAYLKKCGYKVIRLSESEVNSGTFEERMVI